MKSLIPEKQLRKHLKSKTKKELLDEICSLSQCYEVINEHYYSKYSCYEMQSAMFSQLMDKINGEFEPESGLACPRIDYLKNEIHKYSLKCTQPVFLAHIHVHLAATCLEYLLEYSDLVYNSLDNEVYNHLKSFVIIINNNSLPLNSHMEKTVEYIISTTEKSKPDIHERLVRMFEKYNFKFDL